MPTNPSQFTTLARLGKNPKVFYINGGNTQVVGLNLAIDDDYIDKNGEWRDQTVWTYAEVFGKRAEYVLKNMRKGDQVMVAGKVKMATNEDGQQWLKFWLNDIRLISRPQQRQAPSETHYNQHPQDEEDMSPAFQSEASGMDDIPF